MALLTNAAIKGYRDYTMRRVAYARYKVGSTFYKARIEKVEVSSAGIVEISFEISLPSGSGTVSQIELYDTDNQLWLSKTEKLEMDSVAKGFWYVVQLEISEKVKQE